MNVRAMTGLQTLVFLAACAGAQGSGAPDQPPADRGLERVLASRDIDGRPVGPPEAGTRAQIVVVFASWCGVCRAELAMLGEIASAEPALRILGLNAYEAWDDRSDEARLRGYLEKSAPWLRVVRAEDGMLEAFGGVSKVPTLFVYDREGRIVREFRRDRRGAPTRSEIEAAIAAADRKAGP